MKRIISLIEKVCVYMENKVKIFDMICAMLLALVPLLQHYKGIVDNAATTLLIILIPYMFLRVFPKLKGLKASYLGLVLSLIIFYLYKIVDHGTSFVEIAQACIVISYLVTVVLGCINTKMLIKAASVIAAMAGICIIIQYFCYYVLGFHLQMVPVSLFLEESEPWILVVQTGIISITGEVGRLYRPSAFFLEPSHLFMYSFPILFINMFSKERTTFNKIVMYLVTAAMILSTSGMGIVVAAGAWVLFFAFWNEKDKEFSFSSFFRKRNMIGLGILFGIFVLIIIFVPFVRSSVVRIFFNPRTTLAIRELKKMNLIQWIIGVADSTTHLTFNMPGFMAMSYKYGIIGIILSYEFYVKGLFKLDFDYFWVSVLLILVSFFSAHTHGTFFQLYYVFILMEGYMTTTGKWIGEISTFFNKCKNCLLRKKA